MDGRSLPRDRRQLLGEFEAILAEDRGFAGEDMHQNESGEPPEKMGSRGFYGDHGPFNVIVHYRPSYKDQITVSASNLTRSVSEVRNQGFAKVGVTVSDWRVVSRRAGGRACRGRRYR